MGFGTRVRLAISAFFSILGSGALPDDVVAAMGARATVEPADRKLRSDPSPVAPPEPPGHRAAQVLALLQRDGRLLDFLMEDLSAYDDAQVGAAVRDVHAGARQAVTRYFTLEPVIDDEEGRPVTVERGTDASRVKVVGSVTGQLPLRGVLRHRGWEATRVELPLRGVLRHRGWEATRVELPPLPQSGQLVIAPAEVEVS